MRETLGSHWPEYLIEAAGLESGRIAAGHAGRDKGLSWGLTANYLHEIGRAHV